MLNLRCFKEFTMNNQSFVPTPDEIWNLLKETGQQIKELSAKQAETDKQIDKTGRQIETLSAKTDKQIEKTGRYIQKVGGRFNERWGALLESLVEGKLVKIFQERGIDISHTHSRTTARWKKPDGSFQEREFDIIVANGTEVVEVEVKTTLNLKNVNVFLERIRNFKNFLLRYKTETVYGAVAFLKSEDEAHLYAEKEGLFVIRATGDSASIINKKDFKPKVFG